MRVVLIVVFSFILDASCQKKCVSKQFDKESSFVCACNSTYCDEIPPLPQLVDGDIVVYTTDIKDKRFDQVTMKFSQNSSASNVTISIDSNQQFQKIIGFGGAFTDSTGFNVLKLPIAAQQNWVNSYFGPQGIGYTLGRVPMASCDFSTHEYSFDDPPLGSSYVPQNFTDFNLTYFNLAPDFDYKIPLIKMALDYIGANLKLFASPWSAPAWMKTNYDMVGNGSTMRGSLYNDSRFWDTWSKYFVRFFEEYSKQNIRFWGLTVQNEPLNNATFQEMFMPADEQRDFLKKFLGPAIRTNPLTNHLKIMIYDFNRGSCGPYGPDRIMECGADKFIDVVLADEGASSYVDGVAMHWYDDFNYNASVLDTIYNRHSDKWILHTEACAGFYEDESTHGVALGNWTRGEQYAHDIIENLNHWSTGWTDWNMALDTKGGPNWVNNLVDSPTVVAEDNLTFYKQPMFYVLGHFSKFILPNSVRVSSKFEGVDPSLLEGVAFLNPQNQTVLVIHNRGSDSYQIAIQDACASNQVADVEIEPNSIKTLVWNHQCVGTTQATQPQGTSPTKSAPTISVYYLNLFLLIATVWFLV